ncbi:hypothetical protein C8F01DRAFT_1313116 [Mycena amicta]|nr:hypothetical protein C8F01DRAFT_1313116 [Mycena amicta]
MFASLSNPLTFSVVKGIDVSDETLKLCGKLFSENYGVWNAEVTAPLRPGARVKMNAKKLREQCLSKPEDSVLALCTADDVVITQLVVSSAYRRRSIATSLLGMIPTSLCTAMGLVSSHPASCLALAKRARANIRKPDLSFIKRTAPLILDTTPIDYIKTAQLHGSLFEDQGSQNGTICSVFTDFPVDHAEPLTVLRAWESAQDMAWPLGALAEGHEYLVIVSIKV